MLTGRKLVFIGGDARQLEIIAQATELDASATLIGFDSLPRPFQDTTLAELSTECFEQADAIILPIAGMDDDGRVTSEFTHHQIVLRPEHFLAMKAETFIFSGIARPALADYCAAHRLRLVKLMEQDDIAILNSIPTAEGAVALAMQHTDITIHGSSVIVLGFGRCGQTLARTLAALGAKVFVGARKLRDLARIQEMSLQPFALAKLEQVAQSADIVFNTIPAPILTASVLNALKRECVIIDIASKPGGTDFRYAERRGMVAILAPSLPGSVAPKTAGRIIASTVCRLLSNAD